MTPLALIFVKSVQLFCTVRANICIGYLQPKQQDCTNLLQPLANADLGHICSVEEHMFSLAVCTLLIGFCQCCCLHTLQCKEMHTGCTHNVIALQQHSRGSVENRCLELDCLNLLIRDFKKPAAACQFKVDSSWVPAPNRLQKPLKCTAAQGEA